MWLGFSDSLEKGSALMVYVMHTVSKMECFIYFLKMMISAIFDVFNARIAVNFQAKRYI